MAETDADNTPEPLHLAIIGGGVAGCAAADWASSNGARVTLFNAGIPLGGSCIHVGTFPARVLMNAATDLQRARRPRFPGILTEARSPDWNGINTARRELSEAMGRDYSRLFEGRPNIEIVNERATFIDRDVLKAGERTFYPERIVLTPGSHSLWPDMEGLDKLSPISIAGLANLDKLPEKIIFWGTNDVSLAYCQALARLGTKVTILTENPRLLIDHFDANISSAIHEVLAEDGVRITTTASITRGERRDDGGSRLIGTVAGAPAQWDIDTFVIVNHRRPRIEQLGLVAADIEVTEDGFIVIDESLQTTNPAVFAAGDAIGRGDHAYAAAYDAVLAARNAISPSRTAGHNTVVPFAIYTDPQLAGVGWDEHQANEAGFAVDTAICSFEELPAAHAMGSPEGFVKLIRDERSDHLLGARIMGANASELIMELALAVRYGLTTSELAIMVHPPISMGEAISRAARTFQARKSSPIKRPPSRPGA